MTALPAGWVPKPLSDVCLPVMKADPVSTGHQQVRYVDIGSVDGERHRLPEIPWVDAESAPSRCRQIIEDGDTLFSTVRPYLEKIAFVDSGLDGEFASTGFCVLRPGPEVLPRYLFHYSVSRQMLDQVLKHQRGVSYPAVLDKNVKAVNIPLPPLEEQRRIVNILEDHLSRVDAAERYLASADELVNNLQMGLLASGLHGGLVQEDLSDGTGHELVRLCGGDPSAFVLGDEDRAWPVPSSWSWMRIADLFEVYVGATPSRADKSLWGGDLAWVSSGEVAFNRITSTHETVQLAAVGNPLTRIHEPGTVMLAMIGEGKTRGQAAILDITAAHNQNCASIRVARTPVLPEYIFSFLRERYIETRRAASGGNQPALNKGVIGRIPVPIPPLGTQRRLVAAFQEAEDSADALRRAIQGSRARACRLRNSLLAAAFSGLLTGRSTDMEIVEEMASV